MWLCRNCKLKGLHTAKGYNRLPHNQSLQLEPITKITSLVREREREMRIAFER